MFRACRPAGRRAATARPGRARTSPDEPEPNEPDKDARARACGARLEEPEPEPEVRVDPDAGIRRPGCAGVRSEPGESGPLGPGPEEVEPPLDPEPLEPGAEPGPARAARCRAKEPRSTPIRRRRRARPVRSCPTLGPHCRSPKTPPSRPPEGARRIPRRPPAKGLSTRGRVRRRRASRVASGRARNSARLSRSRSRSPRSWDRSIATPVPVASAAAAITATAFAAPPPPSAVAPPAAPAVSFPARGFAGSRSRGDLDQHPHEGQRQDDADAMAEGEPGAVDQPPHRVRAGLEGGGDLVVRAAVERAADERLALAVRERFRPRRRRGRAPRARERCRTACGRRRSRRGSARGSARRASRSMPGYGRSCRATASS